MDKLLEDLSSVLEYSRCIEARDGDGGEAMLDGSRKWLEWIINGWYGRLRVRQVEKSSLAMSLSLGQVYNPFYDFFDTFDSLCPQQRKRNEGQVLRTPGGSGRNWLDASPQIDLYDKPERYEVVASVPGISIENLHINFDPETSVLSISGEDSGCTEEDKQYLKYQERWSGKFERSISIPKEPRVLEDEINASINNGVLKITVPKKPANAQKPEKKKIKVQFEGAPDSGN